MCVCVEDTIKVRDLLSEFTFTSENKHFGIPIAKFVEVEDVQYPYNEFILTFWTKKNVLQGGCV